MPFISQIDLAKNKDKITVICQENGLENVRVFGLICGKPWGTSAELDLLVDILPHHLKEGATGYMLDHEDIMRHLEHATSQFSALFNQANIKIHTEHSLRVSERKIDDLYLPISHSDFNAIMNNAKSLAAIINEGTSQLELSKNINEWISEASLKIDFSPDKPLSLYNPQQREVLAKLAERYSDIIGNSRDVGFNVYAALDRTSQKIVDYACTLSSMQ